MTKKTHLCQGKARGYLRCDRPATEEVDGKHYCWQHSPKLQAKKAEKREAENKKAKLELYAKITEDHKNSRRLKLYPDLVLLLRGRAHDLVLGPNETILNVLKVTDEIERYNVLDELEDYEKKYLGIL
jgi:CRISPR/Cas system-associated protein Cas5 (RAMP superfamily)